MKLPAQRTAIRLYGFATVIVIFGTWMAAQRYPGGFDWMYTVVSGLASLKHNPEGARWFSVSLGIAMVILWLATSVVARALDRSRFVPKALSFSLRLGLVCGFLVAAERTFFTHFSDVTHKGHEVIALIAFLGLYVGIVGLNIQGIFRKTLNPLPLVCLLLPLAAIGISQLVLYFGKNDFGWVDSGWRARGVPVRLSFAFWQWLAVVTLWVNLGYLIGAVVRTNGPIPRKTVPGRARQSAEGTPTTSAKP